MASLTDFICGAGRAALNVVLDPVDRSRMKCVAANAALPQRDGGGLIVVSPLRRAAVSRAPPAW